MPKKEATRKTIFSFSQELAKDIAASVEDFRLHYVFYDNKTRKDEFEQALFKIQGHPSEPAARDLLKNKALSLRQSSFLGISTAVEKGFLGLNNKTSFLGFVALDLESYSTDEETLYDLYHYTAQALDTYILINRKSVNPDEPDIIYQPKRNQMALARNNLKSDIFSALMMHLNGLESAIGKLAEVRAAGTLKPQTHYRPEDYPFPISIDVMEYAIDNLLKTGGQDVMAVLSLSGKIAHGFDKNNLRTWAEFASPAQTMAWNGFTDEQIIGSAVSMSADPFIKATGNLVSEITRVIPDLRSLPANAGNSFVDEQVNKLNHNKLTEETFEMALIHAVEAGSHIPLLRIANNQNEALLKGRMLGWCADALQSAAKTFEKTLAKGLPPAPPARVEFQSRASHSDWESLDSLNQYVVNQKRNGHEVDFEDITNWCTSRFDLRPVMDSIHMTLSYKNYAGNSGFQFQTSESFTLTQIRSI